MDKVELIEMLIRLILVPLIMWAIQILNGYLTRKVKIEQVESILLQASNAVDLAVMETSQVFVDILKEQGDFNKDAAQEAALRARDRALEILSPAGYELLERSIGDVNAWITAQIEATVWEHKRGS